MRKISIALTALGGLLLSSAAGYALSSNDHDAGKSLQIAQAGGGGGGAGGAGGGAGAGGSSTGGGGGGGAATSPGGAGGGGAATGTGGAGRERIGGGGGGREGMRGEARGGRGGADVNVRVGVGDRGYRRGHGYGVVVHGGGCRTVVVKKRIGYRVVIKKIRRCY